MDHREASNFKVPVEGEGRGDAMPAHQGKAEAIHKTNGLISEFLQQVHRRRFVVLGRTNDRQIAPPVEEASGLNRG